MRALVKKLVSTLVLVFPVMIAIFLTGCSVNEENEDKVLKVGMECAYAPFNWIQPSSENDAVKIAPGWYACGYDVYMSKLIANSMGCKLRIVKIDWDGLFPALSAGTIDAIVAGMSATEERKQTIDFTDNYYDSDVVIVVKNDSPYSNAESINDFSGAKITGQLSTVHYDFIDQIPGVDKQVAMEDFSAMVAAVNSGKVDGYISEKPAAMVAVYTNPTLKYIEFKDGQGFNFSKDSVSIAIGVRKGDSIREKINAALSKIDLDTRKRLMEKAVKNQPMSAVVE